MKVSVLGSSGSVGAPENPASGYLIECGADTRILMDLGPGVLAKLQQYHDPSTAHVLLSHLHADHCLDFPSLMVWRRYHPTLAAQTQHMCIGPADTPAHLGRLSASGGEIDDMSDTFHFQPWQAHQSVQVGDALVTPFPVRHTVETYGLRIEHAGAVVAYSADSDYTEELIACAKDADVFFCEATWGSSSEGHAPNMHMSGAEAGKLAQLAGAKRLVLVHIPPWGDPEGALAAARAHYDGPVEVSYSGMQIIV